MRRGALGVVTHLQSENMEPAAIETFLTTLSQHVVSGANLLFMKRFDTGDRMLDTTVQLIFTTVFGSLMSAMIALYTKGLWTDVMNRTRGWLQKGAYDPLNFEARYAPTKPRNGKLWVFQHDLMNKFTREVILTWWFKHHAHRTYIQELTDNLQFPHTLDEASLTSGDFRQQVDALNFTGGGLPVWRHLDGQFVYIFGRDREWVLRSDSGDAMRTCLAHIAVHEKSLEKTKPTVGPLQWSLGTYDNQGSVDWDSCISAHKTFDTLFFTQKDEILPVLKSFKAGTLYPRHLPIDNKLGILLYGPPGTGKTGFISALANLLGRNVVLVHTSRLQTRKDLDGLFGPTLNNDRIYVFEEFDCMPGVTRRDLLLKDVQAKAESSGASSGASLGATAPDPMAYTMMLMAQKEKSEEILEDMRRERARAQDKLDLGYLLYKLDGLEAVNNRIIIATTNHPERIDPALLRPGRFGIKLHLTNCTRKMLLDIMVMGFKLDDDEREAVGRQLADVPEGLWSPAEVLQIIITKDCVDDVIEHLRTAQPGAL